MQCPKCGHEPTLKEMQASPGSCTACGVVYAKINAKVGVPERRVRTGGIGSKVFILSLAVVVICAAGFFAKAGYDKYKEQEVVSLIKPSVKVASAYLSQQIGYHRSESNITFGEYFERASNAISEIDKLIINLNGIDSSPARSEALVASEYMESVRETIRDMSAIMRATMSASSSSDAADAAHKERLSTSNEYIAQYASERYMSALEEKKKALEKMMDVELMLTNRVSRLKNLSPQVAGIYGSDSVVSLDEIERIKN